MKAESVQAPHDFVLHLQGSLERRQLLHILSALISVGTLSKL